MFNLHELKIIKGAEREANKFSFVGMLRESDGKTLFYLPQGFEEFPDNDYNEIKQFFFRMYRSLRKFVADKRIQDLKYNDAKNQKGGLGNRDDLIIKEGGKVFEYHPPEESEPILIYSKISLLEGILDGYDELKIIALEKRHRQTTEIDYSKLHRYLEYATFLPDHTIYIDNMNLPKHTLTAENTSIVEMFCYLYQEIKIQLEDPVELLAQTLSQKFKEAHLHSRLSLFDGDSFQETHILLCEILAQINKLTIYKDEDYWHFYEAVEDFLYGNLSQEKSQDGIVWGMNNFSSVWEEMCQYYYWTNYSKDILYADTQINIAIESELHQSSNYGGQQIVIKKGFTNPFFLEIRRSDSSEHGVSGEQKRWMRPDLIRQWEHYYCRYINERDKDKRKGVLTLRLSTDKSADRSFEKFRDNIHKWYRKNVAGFTSRTISGWLVLQNFPIREWDKYKINNKIENKVVIVDFKYYSDFNRIPDSMMFAVIVKQLVYKYALHLVNTDDIELQFFIPHYRGCSDTLFLENEVLPTDLPEAIQKAEISVIKADFSKILATYIGSVL